MKKSNNLILIAILIFAFAIQGCGTIQKAKRSDKLELEVAQLQDQIAALKAEKNSELESAKKELEKRLKNEIAAYEAKLEMTERGLVVTFLAEVFFDSGKDLIKEQGEKSIKSVGDVLNKNVPSSEVAVEGYTDNEPIKHSGWKSNWELSTARSLAVLHYLIDKCKVKPERLSAVGYGEYRSVTTNNTSEGRQKNRRVEIVILPSNVKKIELQE